MEFRNGCNGRKGKGLTVMEYEMDKQAMDVEGDLKDCINYLKRL